MKQIRCCVVLVLGILSLTFWTEKAPAQSISPSTADVGLDGGTGSVTVTAPPGTTWSAVSNDGWVQIVSPSSGSGTGNGTVDYTVVADITSDINHYSRTGTLNIAGQVFTVKQHRAAQVPYEAWSVQLPANSNGPGQDAAGDGIANIVKYALGLDALKPSRGGLPTISLKNGVMTYSLTKPNSIVGLRYKLRTTSDLGTTNYQDVALLRISETAGTETWQATVPANGPMEFALTTLAQVGATAREVQQSLLDSFNTFSTNFALWNIQPGLGTVMVEYGRRVALMKLAASHRQTI